MRGHILVSVCLILVLTTLVSATPKTTVAEQALSVAQEEYEVERDWTIQIVIVNYDSELINEEIILQNLPEERVFSTYQIKYNIEYEVAYAPESYTDSLRTVMLENSVNGSETGTRIDEDKLYEQRISGDPKRVFYPRAGRAIDAYEVEDWLAENPAVTPPGLGYILYLVNFSEFDSSDHSLEHWYDGHPIDPDTGEEQDWFRLEWDNELNPDVKYEYPGFGGRYNLFVLDPSADQWYLRWARIWWGDPPYDSDYEHCTTDLDEKVRSLDLTTQAGKDSLNIYLRDYIHDPIAFLFVPGHHEPSSYVSNGYLKGLVFCMDVDEGISVNSLRWVTNAEMQEAHLEEFIPFIDWEVDIEFLDIDDYVGWNATFWDYAEIDGDGTTVADGYGMFGAIYSGQRPNYVDVISEDVQVFGVVFIKKSMVMIAGGGTFTGLGGGGQTVIWQSWERYYRPDGVTPKNGISSVQLHESMHAVGIMHTWDYNHYVGDFSYSPMGYHAMHNGTCTFDQNWAQSTYLDQMEIDYSERLRTHSEGVNTGSPEKVRQARDAAEQCLEEAVELYNQMDWMGCYQKLQECNDWTERLIYSKIDDTPPEIRDWGIEWDTPSGIPSVWADVRDDLSGVDRVYVKTSIGDEYLMTKVGGNWTTELGELPTDIQTDFWIEAWDWGMNSATSDVLTYGTIYNPLVLLQEPVVIIALAALIALVLVVWRRRE